jgi:hypothetical protein
LQAGGFTVRTGNRGDMPVRLQLGALYDPQRLRVVDR